MDNHFTVKRIWNDADATANRPFLDFSRNDSPLRYQCLVDVFNGKCYYTRTPEQEEEAAPLVSDYP